MKRHKFTLSTLARKNIEEIYRNISIDMENPILADKTIEKIFNKCHSLTLFPEASPVKFSISEIDFRHAHIKRYTIIYYLDGDGSVVIYSVVSSQRDILGLLRSTSKASVRGEGSQEETSL